MHACIQYDEPYSYVQQAEAYYRKPHDSAGAERDLQAGVQRAPRGIGRAAGGVSGGLHANEAREAREETSRKESERYPWILYMEAISQDGEKHHEYCKYYDDNFVLLLEISHRPLPHELCDAPHRRRSFILLPHLLVKSKSKGQGYHRCRRNGVEQGIHTISFLSPIVV